MAFKLTSIIPNLTQGVFNTTSGLEIMECYTEQTFTPVTSKLINSVLLRYELIFYED